MVIIIVSVTVWIALCVLIMTCGIGVQGRTAENRAPEASWASEERLSLGVLREQGLLWTYDVIQGAPQANRT